MMREIDIDKYDIPGDFDLHEGTFSAVYFNKTKEILDAVGMDDEVLMQVFQKKAAVLSGIDEAAAIVLRGAPDVEVIALPEGSVVEPWETVMTIRGPLRSFVHLESLYLGVLSAGTTVATNTRAVVEAANGKPVIYLADRFNHWSSQATQGNAAITGGAVGVCTEAMTFYNDFESMGTMPHALIAAFGGDVVAATQAYIETYPEDNAVALVDFNNDCVTDAVETLEAVGDKLYAVRLDTSEKMMDASRADGQHPYRHLYGDYDQHPMDEWNKALGVNPILVRNVRSALSHSDAGKNVKIIVSGGFDVEKITYFEGNEVPVDIYGVGSSLLKNSIDFTADVVYPVAKMGRSLRPNDRLERVV